jgi:hypothetical protein
MRTQAEQQKGDGSKNPTRLPGQTALPTRKELDKIKKDHFGDKPGSVRIDTDVASGETKLIFVDEQGKEVGKQAYKPSKEA